MKGLKLKSVFTPAVNTVIILIIFVLTLRFLYVKDSSDVLSLKDSSEEELEAQIVLLDESGKKIQLASKGTYDTEVIPKKSPVKKIKIKGLKVSGKKLDLGIDNVPDLPTHGRIKFKKIYAIDPSKIKFEDAIITSTATAKHLFRCDDWDFAEQECRGSWVKIMDLVPGQEYSFSLKE